MIPMNDTSMLAVHLLADLDLDETKSERKELRADCLVILIRMGFEVMITTILELTLPRTNLPLFSQPADQEEQAIDQPMQQRFKGQRREWKCKDSDTSIRHILPFDPHLRHRNPSSEFEKSLQGQRETSSSDPSWWTRE
jgi:hypothetical protein